MKNTLTILATLIAININAATIKFAASPNITRHGGQEIPVTFTASGFAPGTIGQVWLVNSKTWQVQGIVFIDLPINNGVNTVNVGLAWSWWETGNYVVRIVTGGGQWTGATVVTIRSAVIWPYPGSSYARNSIGSASWSTESYINADYLTVYLLNETTWEMFGLVDEVDPTEGHCSFTLPSGVTGNNFRVVLDGYVLIDMTGDEEGYMFPDLCESAMSGRVSIK